MITYILYELIWLFNHFVIVYVTVMSGIFVVQTIIAIFSSASYAMKTRNIEYRKLSESPNMIPMSVLMPGYNEQDTIVDSVKSMMTLHYPEYEVIVINDGSKDDTLQTVIKAFSLQKIDYPLRERIPSKKVRGIYYNPDIPRLKLIDKENGGKADALNAGINLSLYPYFVSVDADSLLQSDALLRLAIAFMEDKHTIAAGGVVRVVNGCKEENGEVVSIGIPKGIWAKFQLVEYFRAFLVGRMGWNSTNALLIISGAFGAFQKEHVLSVGGYTTGTVGEDMELVIKLHEYMLKKKYKYKVLFMPDPICWTQVPEDLKVLYRQRRRWQIGLIDVMGRHRKMFLNPRYKAVGLLGMPYFFLFEMVAPIVETLGYFTVPASYYFGIISFEAMALFFIASVFFGVIISMGSLIVEQFSYRNTLLVREFLLLTFLGIAENLFYRQMTVYFRLMGILQAKKHKHSWGAMTRRKFSAT
ncbi:MAG: glycosyltransferase family 2 protein [Treponema sp.]|jgi:cellulose synthase/poly-beta-1,6-N-acetylglucosamine synthase-like glycosyltransferase|nr:glycosyltransferase family 2 protein [Treponema sp.]